MRCDVVLSPELYAVVEQAAAAQGVKVSAFLRTAIAAYVGRPELAGELKAGRRWPADPKKRARKKAPAKKRTAKK